MTRSMQASLTAIGRQLHDGYLPTLAKPLPSELDLVARLVALEINNVRIEQASHRGVAISPCIRNRRRNRPRVIGRHTGEIWRSS